MCVARLQHMLILIVINLVIGFAPGSRIDNWGHIGGMLGGLVLALRIGPRLTRPSTPVRSMREFAKTDAVIPCRSICPRPGDLYRRSNRHRFPRRTNLLSAQL